MININEEELKKVIVDQVVDELVHSDGISGIVTHEVTKRIDKIFDEQVEKIIEASVKKAIDEGFERQYQRVNSWGQAEGEPTSISKELERLINTYWSDKVDARSGKVSSGYGAITRAEFVMMQICSDDFSGKMKQAAADITGDLKDGLRAKLMQNTNSILDDLFRVKSLGDQNKRPTIPNGL